MLRAGGEERWEKWGTAKGYGVSFGDGENILKLIAMIVE